MLFFSDLEGPTISTISDHNLPCGDPFEPSDIETPTVQDAQDANPTLIHEDVNLENCQLERTWTAMDAAGNKETSTQVCIISIQCCYKINSASCEVTILLESE